MPISQQQHQQHPAPHRDRASTLASWTGLLLAPGGWGLQLLATAAFGSHACYPHDVPLTSPAWDALRLAIAGLQAAAFIACVAGGVAAWTNWRRTQHEGAGGGEHLVEGGDGRTRFMAMAGMMVSGLFALAVILSAASLAAVPACGR